MHRLWLTSARRLAHNRGLPERLLPNELQAALLHQKALSNDLVDGLLQEGLLPNDLQAAFLTDMVDP